MRTEDEIEAGIIPGVEHIVLGGKKYPAKEPSNARARLIRRTLAAYETARAEAGNDGAKQLELVEDMIDACLRGFSLEIEADWERIAETATDSERLAAIKVVRDSVMEAFMTLAGAATPAPNRETRRAKKP